MNEQQIAKQVAQFRGEINLENDAHKKVIRDLNEGIHKLQSICPHTQTHTLESFLICNSCSKVL